jgi:hypothetical protein
VCSPRPFEEVVRHNRGKFGGGFFPSVVVLVSRTFFPLLVFRHWENSPWITTCSFFPNFWRTMTRVWSVIMLFTALIIAKAGQAAFALFRGLWFLYCSSILFGVTVRYVLHRYGRNRNSNN